MTYFAYPKNKLLKLLVLSTSLLLGVSPLANAQCAPWLDKRTSKLHSQDSLDLCALTAGKTVLIVNTASHCGFTSQFKGLQSLYERYRSENFTVIGFPSNSFRQEAKNEEETANICYVNFGVKFPMTGTVNVRGEQANSVFKYLASKAAAPNWNFNKYLVSPSGKVLQHFGSGVSPDSKQLVEAIEAAL